MLTAYYDLRHSPPTYDFVSFLLYAEMIRRRMGAPALEIRFAAGPVGGFRRDSLWPRSVEQRAALLQNLLRPMVNLLPYRGTSECEGRAIGAGRALYGLARYVEAMRATGPSLVAQQLPLPAGLITITLRECEHWPERNSSIEEWKRVAERLLMAGHAVVFIRDTLKCAEPLDGFDTDRRAAVDIEYRAGLYASARMNLFVSNGPAWLCMAIGAPCLIFRPCDDRSPNRAAHSSHLAACGLPFGDQMPGALPSQRIVWADDRADIILGAFREVCDAVG